MASDDALDHPSIFVDMVVRSKDGRVGIHRRSSSDERMGLFIGGYYFFLNNLQ